MQQARRRVVGGVALGLLVGALGGCGTTVARDASPVASPSSTTPSSSSTPAARTPSPFGTPQLDSPAPNGGPGAACAGWTISFAPTARGERTPGAAVEAYLRENREWSTTPAEQWTLTTPGPSGDSVTARAGTTTLEIAHLEDGTWLAVSGQRC